jgi:hypothetical protein
MNITRIQGSVALLAIVLIVQTSAGAVAPQTGNKNGHTVEITFTKWITTAPLMEGFTGGDVTGDYVGEVLQFQQSLTTVLNAAGLVVPNVTRLEAVYEVQSGDQSFTSLVRGGESGATGAAILDGKVLNGWRTGADVHVEFQATSNCDGAPDARPCFQGTIRVGAAPKD